MLHGRSAALRFLYMFGGCTELWSNMSAEAEVFAVRMTFGAKAVYKSAGREPTDYVNSKLILMWGWSPGDGTFGTGTWQYLRQAKKQGVRIVCVDPRRTRSSTVLADEHVFIQPSTDAAALIAMAYVIASEGLHDQAYCDAHVLGFDEDHLPPGAPAGASYLSYLNGAADGVKKTPEWAAEITGIPAETIRRLAIEFATTKPAALQCGYAPGRTAYGEQFHRAAYALAAMTGNVGVKGGNSGVSNGATGRTGIKSLPAGTNPIDARVASPLLADLLARGKSGGYPADIKLIYSVGGDLFNQAPNVNKMVRSLDGVEFLVVQDHFLTPTAQYADIVLPATTFWERNDVHTPWAGAGHYAIFMKQAIEPMDECRNDIDIFADLAAPRRHRGLQRQERDGLAARADERRRRRLRRLRRERRRPLRGPRGRGRLRPRDPRSRSATSSPRRRARSRSIRWRWPPIPIPTGSAPCRPSPPGCRRSGEGTPYPLKLLHAEVAGADALDPQQPARARPRRPRRRLAAPGGRRRARHRRRRPRARVQRSRRRRAAGARDRPHRAGRGVDQGGRLVHPRRRRAPTPGAAPTC